MYSSLINKILVLLSIIISIYFSSSVYANNCNSSEIYETSSAALDKAMECLPILGQANLDRYRQYAKEFPNNEYYRQFLNATVDEMVDTIVCGRLNISKRFVIKRHIGANPPSAASGYTLFMATGVNGECIGKHFFEEIRSFYYKKVCEYPFLEVDGECATYCPPDAPELQDGQCVEPEQKQCEFNPVVMGSGEKLQIENDVVFGTKVFPISIKRIYRSRRAEQAKTWQRKKIANNLSPEKAEQQGWVKYTQKNGHTNRFSPVMLLKKRPSHKQVPIYGDQNWAYSNFHYLSARGAHGSETNAKVHYGDETEVFSIASNNSFTSNKHLGNSLKKTGDKEGDDKYWQYKHHKGDTLYFNRDGMVTSVINSNGLVHRYKWQKSIFANYKENTLTISDDFGHNAIIKFDFYNTITSIQTSTGMLLTYQYDEFRNLTSLTKSISSSSGETSQLTKTYHYDDLQFPYALTGITDENGVRYATWQYDDLGRVVKSAHANGINEGTISYEKDLTTTTNALGKQTKYHYAKIAGTKRLSKVEGVQTAHCAASHQAYTYYDSGRVKTKTDWQGNVTYFEYNEQGRVTKKVQGYGTEKAYTVETKWDNELNKPMLITYPEKTETFKYNDDGLLVNKLTQSRN